MNNRLLFFWVFSIFFSMACKEQQKEQQKEIPSINAPAAPTVVVNDTVYETQYLYEKSQYPYYKSQGEFKVGEDVYSSFTESYSLNDSAFTVILTQNDHAIPERVKKLKAHNHVYKIRLAKNGKLVYEKQFTKHDFLQVEDDGFIKESVPVAPNFRGVTSDGKVLFDMWFALPDSDFGGISYFSTDMKGKLLDLESYSSTGGNGCDGVVHTSPSHFYYLSCQTLYGPNGYKFKFGKPDMVAAEFLTDTSFFALYDFLERKTNPKTKEWEEKRDYRSPNFIIYHIDGRKLANFRYDGFTIELDYTAPIRVLREEGKFLLLDATLNEIRTVPLAEPSKFTLIQLEKVKKLSSTKDAEGLREVQFKHALGKQYSIYFSSDTIQAYFVKDSQ